MRLFLHIPSTRFCRIFDMRQPLAALMISCWLCGRQAGDWGWPRLSHLKRKLAQFTQCYSRLAPTIPQRCSLEVSPDYCTVVLPTTMLGLRTPWAEHEWPGKRCHRPVPADAVRVVGVAIDESNHACTLTITLTCRTLAALLDECCPRSL